MKSTIIIASILFFSLPFLQAQEKSQTCFPLLGDDAPSFNAESSAGILNFPDDFHNKWKILFSHPADFTPVCTTEILELAASQKDFDKLGTSIIVVSADKLASHIDWKKNMETIIYKNRKPVKIEFPLVSDPDFVIAREYGMIHPNSSVTNDVRGVFIIDPGNKIRAIFFYPMNIGRNLGEIERTLVALQTADKDKVLIPANWVPGGDVLMPGIKTTADADKIAEPGDSDYYKPTWYMVFKKGEK